MEANPVRITQYFDGEKQSIIPLFQRPYTWEKRNWSILWEDIISYVDDVLIESSHFMGAVVSIPARSLPIGVTKHMVIDGQQRLTTVAILLCALRDSVEKRMAEQINDYLVNRHYDYDSEDYLKLMPTQGDREAYFEIVNSPNSITKDRSTHRIHEAYVYYKEMISNAKNEKGESISPSHIFEIIRKVLQVIMINLSESDDPYLIFESLNFKGVPLTQSDLIRNYILMRFKHSINGGEQERIYKEIWSPAENRLGDNLNDFLWHYISRNGDIIRRNKVYLTFKDIYKAMSEKELLDELINVSRHSKYYEYFYNPNLEKNPKIKKILVHLVSMEVSIAFPLMLRIWHSYNSGQISENIVYACLKIIDSFVIRRMIIDEKRSALNKLFLRMCKKYPTSDSELKDLDLWIKSELMSTVRSERWPDDDEVVKYLTSNSVYGTKVVKILLSGVEHYLSGKETIDVNSLQIEHIMPQDVSKWKESLGDSWQNTHENMLHMIGNLTLTGLNSELSNSTFAAKKKIYSSSNIALNREISNFDKWTEYEIIERSKYLANIVIRIWSR